MLRLFITDCEGPISKNDNAFELACHYIPDGDFFFTLISKYDDVLADVVKRPGYKAGDTLKLILPFLKAYGATDEGMREYSSRSILLVPGAVETLKYVNEIMPSFIVSTSYEPYISALCEVVGFPKENVYCTKVNIDRYKLEEDEAERLRELRDEIVRMPMIEVPKGARTLDELPSESRRTVERLDEIFWDEISNMEIGVILKEVNPVGGSEKAKAVKEITEKLDVKLSDVMYVGDSITDVSPFQLVRENGGLTVSFNGNEYAIREAEIAVLSSHTVVISILADVFNRFGKDEVLKLAEGWSPSLLAELCNPTLLRVVSSLKLEVEPRVERITGRNRERLMRESGAFRKTVRGEAIGRLG